MKRLLGFVLAVAGVLAVTAAKAPAKVAPVRLDISAVMPDIAVLAGLSWRLGTEQARCVTKDRVERGENGVVTITVLAIGPAEVAVSDSMHVWVYPSRDARGEMKPQVCGDSMPGIHTHLPINGELNPYPSDDDEYSLTIRPRVRYSILVVVADSDHAAVGVYGFKP